MILCYWNTFSEAWGPPQFQEKRSRSEKAILGALGELRGILGATLGIQKLILGMRNSILGMASHDLSNAKTTILGAALGAIPGIASKPHERFSFVPAFSELFFIRAGTTTIHVSKLVRKSLCIQGHKLHFWPVGSTYSTRNGWCNHQWLSGTGDSQRDSRKSIGANNSQLRRFETPIFIARQADSHESLEFPIVWFARFARITPLSIRVTRSVFSTIGVGWSSRAWFLGPQQKASHWSPQDEPT